VMTWMAERLENGIENKVLYDIFYLSQSLSHSSLISHPHLACSSLSFSMACRSAMAGREGLPNRQ
jgi:hypothetical protein